MKRNAVHRQFACRYVWPVWVCSTGGKESHAQRHHHDLPHRSSFNITIYPTVDFI
jgi:hypothetical protein